MDRDALRVGCLLLRLGPGAPAPSGHDLAVELEPAAERAREWLAEGAELAVQALNPIAGLPLEQRRAFGLVAAGPGAGLAALCACAIGFARIAAALHPDDHDPFRLVVEAMGGSSEKTLVNRIEELPTEHAGHLCLLGCGGQAPDPGQMAALVRRLRPEGQLVLFGLPRQDMRDTFEELSRRGLSLRGTGIRGDFGFLAGSPDHGHRLAD